MKPLILLGLGYIIFFISFFWGEIKEIERKNVLFVLHTFETWFFYFSFNIQIFVLLWIVCVNPTMRG